MKPKICCVCGHALHNHIPEGSIWRCHQLGKDCFQCECVLRKDRAENDISYYQLDKRISEYNKQLKKELK